MGIETTYSDDEFVDDDDTEQDPKSEPIEGPSDYDRRTANSAGGGGGGPPNTETEWDESEGEARAPNNNKQDCSNACDCVPEGGEEDVPARKRLAMTPKTNVDKLRASIPFPCEAVPRTHLPNWPDLPLCTKIPSVPAPPGAIIYSRGPVASSLLRPAKSYTLEDPWHMRRVPATEYNALHDEHAHSYLQKPEVRKLLLQQGLITESDEVVCGQRDFNKFRQYLACLHTDELSGMIADGDRRWAVEREQLLALYKYQRQTSAEGKDYERMMKVQNATKKNEQKMQEKAHKLEVKKAQDQQRECRFKQGKQRDMMNRKIVSQEKDRIIAERRRQQFEMDMQRRKEILCNISLKDAALESRVRAERCILKRAYNQFLLEWLDAKYQYQAEEKSKNTETERQMEYSRKKKAEKRQARIEKYREMMPELIEQRKAKEERVWNIVRRLFYKWLRKVRERKARKPDALHQSLWESTVVMEDTLKYLRKESGYEKLDDFILNIMRLKEEIKIKLAEEEAEEERERQKLQGRESEGDEEGEDQAPAPTRPSNKSKKEEEEKDEL